jgi:hypothetical protein
MRTANLPECRKVHRRPASAVADVWRRSPPVFPGVARRRGDVQLVLQPARGVPPLWSGVRRGAVESRVRPTDAADPAAEPWAHPWYDGAKHDREEGAPW